MNGTRTFKQILFSKKDYQPNLQVLKSLENTTDAGGR